MFGQQIFPFILTENTQSQTDNGPQMDYAIATAVMITEFMNLGVTVVTSGDAIIGTGGLNLAILQAAEFMTGFLISGLQKTTTSATAIMVGVVGLHIDKIFFPHDGFHHKTKIFSDWVAITFAYDLARVLYGKLDF